MSCFRIGIAILGLSLLVPAQTAWAWGDEGHEVVALVADHYLKPAIRDKVHTMLAADSDNLTPHDIASEATWADKYRGLPEGKARTSAWHFVDIEIDAPDLDRACFGHPKISPETVASQGPAKDCVVDKIDEFAAELRSPKTNAEERLIALKFLLHFVGDLHQPLHAADHNDRGGNALRVSAPGLKANNLHHYWDTEFVARLGRDDKAIASKLIDAISSDEIAQWSAGTASDWAQESFRLARDHAYGELGQPNDRGSYRLTDAYIADATDIVAGQLSRAGVRLAFVLNSSLGGQ